jgi:hypothetical protein
LRFFLLGFEVGGGGLLLTLARLLRVDGGERGLVQRLALARRFLDVASFILAFKE